MKKYMAKRILFALFSLVVVVMIVMFLVYSLINKNVIFQTDDVWNKKSANDRTIYEFNQYKKYGYVEYEDYSSFIKDKYMAVYGEDYYIQSDYLNDKKAIQDPSTFKENVSVQEFVKKYQKDGYKIVYLPPVTYKSGKIKPGGNPYLIATYEKSVFSRLWNYVKGFITIETKNQVEDPNLTDRYIRFEKDPYSGAFALVGSGTQHKYLIYFDSRFPFMHWNWIHINLGTSYTTYRGQEITTVINAPTGKVISSKQQYPAMIGTDEYADTAIDFHSVTYSDVELGDAEKELFTDNYTVYTMKREGLSMIETSFLIGVIAVILAYLIGIPLGISMARHKDGVLDKIGNMYIIFIMAVPSLAYIFIFAAIGTTLFDLPYKFATAEVKVLAYVLPVISLALPQIGSLMKWVRRYMVDQMNSDYVKFARAEGLSEKEIYRTHISRNAIIYIVHGIPSSIIMCLTGAIITERVYSVPGIGNLLTVALAQHDNGIIVACTVFYTFLSIAGIILGDLLLCKVDPRISLSGEGGGGR
ncbi:MAG: ABC transporter permease [Lachnospiraceae bacterium]|nr:ABC transporter permease [Lachnospiraceae bacterium]